MLLPQPGQHPVGVASNGVDLTVVEDEAVGVGTLPAGVGVGGEAGVHHGDGRLIVRVLQVGIELAQLADEEHTLVDHGAAGTGDHIGVVVGLLKLPAGDVESAVKVQSSGQVAGALHKALLDVGHAGQRLLPQSVRLNGHLAPAEELHALLLHDDLEHLLRLVAAQGVLWEEEHTDAVVPLAAEMDALLLRHAGEEAVRDLQQNADAVAGLPRRVLAGAVLQLFHDLQRVVHGGVGLAPLDVHHAANAAGVVLKVRVVKAPLSRAVQSDFFHSVFPFPSREKCPNRNAATAGAEWMLCSRTPPPH